MGAAVPQGRRRASDELAAAGGRKGRRDSRAEALHGCARGQGGSDHGRDPRGSVWGIAEAYLAEGAQVVVNSRSAEKGEKALAEMGAGDRALFIAGDASRRADVEAVVDGTIEHFGKLDIMVLNAGGVDNTASIVDMSDEEWDLRGQLQPQSHLLGDAAGAQAHAAPPVRPDHRHVVHRGQARQGRHRRVRGQQARHHRAREGGGSGGRHPGHHRERDLSGDRAHRAVLDDGPAHD